MKVSTGGQSQLFIPMIVLSDDGVNDSSMDCVNKRFTSKSSVEEDDI